MRIPDGISFIPVSQDGMICEIRSPMGRRLTLTGTLADIEPAAEGDEAMLRNPALRHNGWAYAKNEKLARRFKLEEKKQSHRKLAATHAATAARIAALVDLVGPDGAVDRWCSGCFTRSTHCEVIGGIIPTYLCATCGTPTLGCAAPWCDHMAVRNLGSVRMPRFCAEHRHELPSFVRANEKVDSLGDYAALQIFERSNLARASRLTSLGVLTAAIVGTGGYLSAPALGGAIGSLGTGYTGAAASSYGLAMLGGGSLAAGGLGMVGGTYVVAAAGAALGGALGASVTSAYIGEDKSFRIEKFRDGVGTPVVIARGFMTETDVQWRAAMRMAEKRYPDSPIYRLHWGSKELKTLASFALKNAGAKQAAGGVTALAARATKLGAKKLGVVAPVLLAADILKNPWHVAMTRADKTGAALAGVLARTNCASYILIGHSLGARAVVTAAETLGTSSGTPRIETVHLLGAATGRKGDWLPLSQAVTDAVHNYYSTNDAVLKYAYKAAQAGSTAVGLRGFGTKFPTIKDHDVSKSVKGHSEYFEKVRLV